MWVTSGAMASAALKVGHHVSAYAVAYALRNTAHVFVAVANFAYAGGKRNGVNRLNDAFRHIRGSAGFGVAMLILTHRVRENLYIAVASEKNYLFREGGNSPYALRAGVGRGKDVKLQKKEEGKVAGIEALVKINGLHVNENVKYLRRAQTNAYRIAYKSLILGQKEAAKILKAIAITAGIVDSAHVNAHGFLKGAVFGRAAVF